MTLDAISVALLGIAVVVATISIVLVVTEPSNSVGRRWLAFKAWRQRRRQARRARARVNLPTLQGQPGRFELMCWIRLEASSAVIAEDEAREALLQAADRWGWLEASVGSIARLPEEELPDVQA